jgi:hypothetical protein
MFELVNLGSNVKHPNHFTADTLYSIIVRSKLKYVYIICNSMIPLDTITFESVQT